MRSIHRVAVVAAVAAACLTAHSSAFAQKKQSAAYTIVDLRSPYHAADGNWSSTTAERISLVDPVTGWVYICGNYERYGAGSSCLWVVSGAGSVTVADLDGVIVARDVNAAGIVGGHVEDLPANHPAVWHPTFGVLELPAATPDAAGWVTALNDPDESGEFQAVGIQETLTPDGSDFQGVVWTITLAGEIVSTEVIRDVAGINIRPYDINDSGEIAGVEFVDGHESPLVAWFDETDALQVEYLPNPDPAAIKYWYDLQIDNAGNVVGDGAEPIVGSIGNYPRGVVWPADGPVVSLSSLTGGGSTNGQGIATVNGVMQVAGSAWTRNIGWYATVFASGKLTDLTKVAKGSEPWSLYEAFGVNSAGWICGRGRVGSSRSGQHHGYVLIPNTP